MSIVIGKFEQLLKDLPNRRFVVGEYGNMDFNGRVITPLIVLLQYFFILLQANGFAIQFESAIPSNKETAPGHL